MRSRGTITTPSISPNTKSLGWIIVSPILIAIWYSLMFQRPTELAAHLKAANTGYCITLMKSRSRTPHVFYVWFDALTDYMTAVDGKGLWPADLHLIGKEILRFHAVFWPAFLMAGGFDLPKKIFAHGWLLFEESKMSKSRGNIVRSEPIRQVIGADALRYFLMREIVFGQDGSFSYDALIGRYNSELANGLGNLVSRTLTMIGQYRGGAIPVGTVDPIADAARQTIADVVAAFDAFEFTRGLEAIWGLLSKLDKFIVERAPWKMARQPEAQANLDATLYTAAEALRIATVLLSPVLPESTAKIWAQLGM